MYVIYITGTGGTYMCTMVQEDVVHVVCVPVVYMYMTYQYT